MQESERERVRTGEEKSQDPYTENKNDYCRSRSAISLNSAFTRILVLSRNQTRLDAATKYHQVIINALSRRNRLAVA